MKPLILLSFSLTFLTQTFADEFSAAAPHDGYLSYAKQSQATKNSSQEWCLSPYHEMHASIRHNEANGIGYKDGYTTVEAFGIYDGWGSGFMPFADLRGHVFNNGKLAGNVGIGERTLFTSINHTFGSYLYYDVRRVGHGLTVNQLSPGIELVGERMEYRINGYFPVGKQKGKQYGFDFDKFKGHSIILKGKQQQAMRGFDAEVGVHIPQNTTYDVYAAAGPYYFKSSNASSWGGRARALGRYKEYVTLEIAYSFDNLFRNVVQGSVAFTLPFGRKLKRCGQGCNRGCPQTDNLLLSRAAFAPSRFEIPVVKRVNKREKAIDPTTGQPWVVWFVNNTSHSAGTFESPFPTLLQAQNASSTNNMIYVFPGDGTTNGMNAGITLQDGQTFFGSGIKQQFATTKGTMTIPAMSRTNPSITTAAGSVVTLGNDNVISGFNVLGSVTNVPVIIASNSNNATVMNNTIAVNSANNGIEINGLGNVNILNNQINDLSGSGSTGISVTPISGENMNGVVNNNSITGFSSGIFFTPDFFGTGTSFDFTAEGNTCTNFSENGIIAEFFLAQQSTINIIGNTINSSNVTAVDGIDVLDISPGSVTNNTLIADNNIVLNGPSAFKGINVSLNAGSAKVSSNSVESTKGAGFSGIFVKSSGTVVCLDLKTNTVVTVSGAVGYNFQGNPGTLNIDSFPGSNIGGPVSTTGNVYNVAPGTCGND